MSVITSPQHLERPQQLEAGHRPSQRRELLKPQKELLKSVATLVAVQALSAIIFAVASENGNTSPYSDWHFSSETYDALNQLTATSFLAALFTGFGLVFTWAHFVKSNQESSDITPEMKIAIQNQIERTLRRN